MSRAYYNEIDPHAAQWMRNLITAGHIAPGDVDERSIEDVRPDDLRGYTQCHFFAGIGVWSYALRLAGWADDRPVWTGSCPCQPFSAAGKGAGFADERHLWPAFFHLIKERKPAKIFGEQVASKDADPWIDLVQDDLEALGYAFGAIPFPASSVGAPNIRDRLYWVADAYRNGRQPRGKRFAALGHGAAIESNSCIGGMADTNGGNACSEWKQRGGKQRQFAQDGGGSGLAFGRMADADGARSAAWIPAQGHRQEGNAGIVDHRGHQLCGGEGSLAATPAGPTNGHWREADWLFCRDGKWRPVEPGTFPLAHGAPARVGRLRAYGNAINAHQAAEFIRAAA